MGLALFLAFFFICHVLPISVLAGGDSNCPERFDCGNLTRISFPFFSGSHPATCGFCMLDCEAKPSPKFAFKFPAERWFYVKSIRDSVISLHDDRLRFGGLLSEGNCHSFHHDIRLPESPSISYSILQNITLYKCTENPETSQKRDNIFSGYKKFDECNYYNGFVYYYQNPQDHAPTLYLDGSIQSSCTAVTFPMVKRDNYSGITDLFQLLTAEFDLEWHLSEDCSDCKLEGHECRIDWSRPLDPSCVYYKKGILIFFC